MAHGEGRDPRPQGRGEPWKHHHHLLENPTPDDVRELWSRGKLLDVGWIEPVDVANAVLFLASYEARYITGIQLPIDAGSTIKWG